MDVSALEDVVLRVSAMVETHKEIAELDLNPVVATPDGAVVADARVRVEAAAPSQPLAERLRRGRRVAPRPHGNSTRIPGNYRDIAGNRKSGADHAKPG